MRCFLAGTITYSFVTAPGEKLKFEINNRTGLIRTTQVLDRDEPAREKEAYLTVLATDNGRPQLDDVCTFKVTIEDVNDNSPVFDKVVRAYPPTRLPRLQENKCNLIRALLWVTRFVHIPH